MSNYNNLIAEFLGTLLFVLSILASGGNPLFIGLTLAVIIIFAAKTSGGHVNPAVSVAMYLRKKMSMNDLVGYVAAQLLGGATSVYLFKMLA
jgi:aquaporin Z